MAEMVLRTGIKLQLCIISVLGFQNAKYVGHVKLGCHTQMCSHYSIRWFSGTAVGMYGHKSLRDSYHTTLLSYRSYKMSSTGENSAKNRIADQLLRSLSLDDHQRRYIESLSQGSKNWLMARKNRLTASNFGTAVGHNPYKTPDDLVQDMLFETFKGNNATQWGNQNEDVARKQYIEQKTLELSSRGLKDFYVSESGLHISVEVPWLAASPDGHVHEAGDNGLLEIKCPYSKRLYPEIPQYYMDQIQGIMGIIGYKWTDFVVWTPTEMSVTRVPFNEVYWREELYPALREFYFNRFIPAYVQSILDSQKVSPLHQEKNQVSESFTEIHSESMVLKQTKESGPVSSGPPLLEDSIIDEQVATEVNECWIDEPASNSDDPKSHSLKDKPSLFSTSPDSGSKMQGLKVVAPGIEQLMRQLERNSLRIEHLASTDSGFVALVTQLSRQGLLPPYYHAYTNDCNNLEPAVELLRYEVMQHMTRHMSAVVGACKVSGQEIFERLGNLSNTRNAGAVELAVAADLFKVHIVCLVVSWQGVQERHFYPSLGAGDESLGLARGRLVLCTAGSHIWSTASFLDQPHLDSTESAPPRAHQSGRASDVPSQNITQAQAIVEEKRRSISEGGSVDSKNSVIADEQQNKAAMVSGHGQDMTGLFKTRYSPLFQQCVVDVEHKLRAQGVEQMAAVRQAFAICKKSIGERRFGVAAVRKDGSAIEDVAGTARRYQSVLVEYQLAFLRSLGTL